MTDSQSGDPKTDVPGKPNVPPSNPPTDPSGVSPQKPAVDADPTAKPAGGGAADSGQAAVDLGELLPTSNSPTSILPNSPKKNCRARLGPDRELHPVQKVGYKLAILVFSFICVCTLMILLISFAFTPVAKPPGVFDSFDEQSVARYERAWSYTSSSVTFLCSAPKISFS